MAQNLKESDYTVGPLSIGSYVSNALRVLPKPISVTGEDEPSTGGTYSINGKDTLLPPDRYFVYEFDSLTIETRSDGSIKRFSYSTKKYVTARGIRIGDSKQKVQELYGKPSEDDWLNPQIGQENTDDCLPYFEGNSTIGISFYIKNGIVVCISVGQGFT